MRATLKPCPFCGGAAYFERMGDRRQSCIIVCEDCGARLESNEEGEQCGAQWNERGAAGEVVRSAPCQHCGKATPFLCADCAIDKRPQTHVCADCQGRHTCRPGIWY